MIAFYMRLSIADGDLADKDAEESNSIETQRLLLKNYVKHCKDLDENDGIVEYIDDGYSGTNFNRPAFQRLLEDMKKGKVSVLLTKDLSRLGRNYIEVGDYMEQIFPILGIRYIAVNSFYDSNNYQGNTMGLEMSISNLVNTLYSKDLSKKVRSGYKARWKQGYSTSGRPTFGYIKDENEKGKWKVEPEAATIVRMIFDYALQGMRISSIVYLLNENKIMTPGRYRELHGHVKQIPRKVCDEEWMWDYPMVYRILRSYEYTGALVHHKCKCLVVGSRNPKQMPKEEQFIMEGAHEPIVTHEEFEKAQLVIRDNPRCMSYGDFEYPIEKKLYCGNCGLQMQASSRSHKTVRCVHKVHAGAHSKCPTTLYDIQILETLVKDTLKTQIALLKQCGERLQNGNKADQEKRKKERTSLEMQLKTVQADRLNLYESFAAGRFGKEDYLQKRDHLKEKEILLKQKLQSVQGLTETEVRMLVSAKELEGKAEDFLSKNTSLSQEACDAFIDEVVIYDKNHIEIKLKFSDLIEKMQKQCREEVHA